jgi:hypothetical protein
MCGHTGTKCPILHAKWDQLYPIGFSNRNDAPFPTTVPLRLGGELGIRVSGTAPSSPNSFRLSPDIGSLIHVSHQVSSALTRDVLAGRTWAVPKP